jgi:hypothetical protein
LPTVTIDEEEWKRVKNDIENLKSERRGKLRKNEFHSVLADDVNSKERVVFEFIRSNPNITKQKVVDHFREEKLLARVSVFKTIKTLVDYGLVIDNEHETNRHTRNLIVNENSIILSVNDEMLKFKRHFFGLLEKVKKRLASSGVNNITDMEERYPELLSSLGNIYEKFVSIYMFRAILAWTNKINDKQTLFELYKIILSNIKEIQLRYNELGYLRHGSLSRIPYNNEICTQDEYESDIRVYKENGLENDVNNVIKIIGTINCRYSDYYKLH